MAQYTLQEKVQITEHLILEVNKFWLKHKGELFNHKDFWDETLHSYTNEDWELMLDVMELIRLEDPSCYLPYSHSVFEDARKVIMTEGHSKNPKALDATDAVAVAVCHHFQGGSASRRKGTWSSFVAANPGRLK